VKPDAFIASLSLSAKVFFDISITPKVVENLSQSEP
jgi:hypothetical protein